MEPKERKVLIVTGAGASTNLALEGRLPMMADWAEILREDIDEVGSPGTSDAIGLTGGLSAVEFEEALGSFIAFQTAVPLMERFLDLGGPHPGSRTSEVVNWISKIKERGDEIVEALRVSLYREFGRESLDRGKCKSFIQTLRAKLGAEVRWALATTNYDVSLEIGLEASDLMPNDGFTRTAFERPTFSYTSIVDWEKNHADQVPVLHLHGAVGWYVAADGTLTRQFPDQPYNPTLGTPAILPPDPEKDPAASGYVEAIWREFHNALEGCTHILILGHSLHDPKLIESIFTYGHHAAIGLTSHSPNLSEPVPGIEDLVGNLGHDDPLRWVIAADLGPKAAFSHDDFSKWLLWSSW